MKKTLVFVMAMIIVMICSAINEEEARAYFQRCILNLDPIEGFYSVEFRGNGSSIFGNAWSQYSNTTLLRDMYIVKMNEQRDGRYLVCIGNTDNQNWDYYWVLENIGTTGAYKFYVLNYSNEIVQSCQVILNNGISFTASFSNMRASGSDTYRVGDGQEFQINFIKSFPTAEMYRSAIREEINTNYSYSSGTAFALNGNYFATNYHVYGDKKYALAKGIDNKSYRAYYVAGDEANDLAVFQIRDPDFKGFKDIPYCLTTQSAEIGEEAWTIGYPETDRLGDEAKYTKGEISALSGTSSEGGNIRTNDTRFYQITTPISHGNSGGPLFDESGNLIGVTSNGWTDLNNINYAIKSNFLQILLESFGLDNAAPKQNTLIGLKQKDQIKKVKPFVFMVLCYNNKNIEEELLLDSLTVYQEHNSVQQTKKPIGSSDTILKVDATMIFAKIVNIDNNIVLYKDLQFDDENVLAIDTSEIRAIAFVNGVRRTYNNPPIQDTISFVASFEQRKLISRQGKTYYCGDQALTNEEYVELIKTCDDAWNVYNTKMPRVGIGLMCGGGILIVTGGALYGALSFRSGFVIALLGTVSVVTGGLIYGSGIKKKRNAYEIYNDCPRINKQRPDRFINLQVCQNGLGICFRF